MISISTNALPSLNRAGVIPFPVRLRLLSAYTRTRQPFRKLRPRPRRRRSTAIMGGKRSLLLDNNAELAIQNMANTMPTSCKELGNTALTTLGAMGNHAALEEMLKRHIMNVDNVNYKEACKMFLEIEKKNHESEHIFAVPFQLGILTCFSAGVLSIPLVFHLPTVEYFNEHFVTAEHPPTKELETALEVGSWSWNWMEPVLGTSTFLLLSMQYMRMHFQHLGVTPYTHHMKRFRGKRLADKFPQYNPSLLFAYSDSSPMYNPKHLW
eukprot:CAMPEP_0194212684 /NCGR_PEP_ID=MMETSP0156-20130528/12707_1 /TAXON_ID=33649 /ORGANISM="Thalassionema nitzschioides, Strain L26-B" /LENGTH=266 /DNA_ID=CAMNT_0038940555 /DNA_START=73 /DNA_END=870 /DNA_ORIENTATION=+